VRNSSFLKRKRKQRKGRKNSQNKFKTKPPKIKQGFFREHYMKTSEKVGLFFESFW